MSDYVKMPGCSPMFEKYVNAVYDDTFNVGNRDAINSKLDKKLSYWFARYMLIKLLDETKSHEDAFRQVVKEILNDNDRKSG